MLMFILWTIMGNKAELTVILTAMKFELRQQKVTQHLALYRDMKKIKWSLDIFRKIERVSAFNFDPCFYILKEVIQTYQNVDRDPCCPKKGAKTHREDNSN